MGIGAIYELAESVTQVLTRPGAIFEGLMRDADEPQTDHSLGWRCYVGIPACRYNDEDGSIWSIGQRVLLVFIDDEKEVYNHRWEEKAIGDEVLPADNEGRFKEKKL